ncbi:MAG TPA: hypothetical protein VME17_03665 [Bryobacteraceae bacterium]|nr:hypothetical protein [Bryobacteraceae bacterium]
MNFETGSPTVLILDDDVAFILWLGELFTESGYRPFPALNSRQAVSLAKKLAGPVDILLVNPSLPGTRRVIDFLAAAQPNLRVLLIHDPSTPGAAADSAYPTVERPLAGERVSKAEWMIKIRKMLMRSAAGQ